MDKAQASVTKSEMAVAVRSVLAGMSVVNRRAETKDYRLREKRRKRAMLVLESRERMKRRKKRSGERSVRARQG